MTSTGHLFPGAEAEAGALLDAYLDRGVHCTADALTSSHAPA